MNIIVIGGTGFIGTHIVKSLLNDNYNVVVFHRGKTHQNNSKTFRSIIGERKNLMNFRDEFRKFKPDAVIDLIAFTKNDGKVLLDTFQDLTGQLILISSMDVYRNYGLFINSEQTKENKIPINENSKLRSKLYPYRAIADSRDDLLYNYDKIPIEQLVLNAKGKIGTVLRLPKVYGIGDKKHRLYEYLKRIKDGREYILLDKKHAKWLWTKGYVGNIAKAITTCIGNEKAKKQIYNIGDEDTFSEKEWIEIIGQIVGWKGTVLTIPPKDLPTHLQSKYNYDYHLKVSSDKIRNELNYKDVFSQSVALEKTVKWELEHQPNIFDESLFDYEAEDKVIKKFKENNIKYG